MKVPGVKIYPFAIKSFGPTHRSGTRLKKLTKFRGNHRNSRSYFQNGFEMMIFKYCFGGDKVRTILGGMVNKTTMELPASPTFSSFLLGWAVLARLWIRGRSIHSPPSLPLTQNRAICIGFPRALQIGCPSLVRLS
jgi:hypothetical protein